MDDFHAKLIAKGKGSKDWANAFTEVEYLGNGKFAASIEDPPDTATYTPTACGDIENGTTRNNTRAYTIAGTSGGSTFRTYVEWIISTIPDTAIIMDTVFKYQGMVNTGDCHIHAMASEPLAQPNTPAGNLIIYNDAGEGTVYADPAGFPEVGINKQVDLGADADTDLKYQLTHGDWFAIGIQGDSEAGGEHYGLITTTGGTPILTLYVVYTLVTAKPSNSIVPLMMTLLEEDVI